MKIDGKEIASKILEDLKLEVTKLREKGIIPTLLVILVGDNQESKTYVRQKGIKAQEIGARSEVLTFDNSITFDQARSLVEKYNKDPNVHGIIIQRPAPKDLRVEELAELIDPKKEIDGFGKNALYPVPVAEATIIMIEDAFKQMKKNEGFIDWLKKQNVAIIGKGETAGKPIIKHLEKLGVNVHVIDRKTPNPKEISGKADILISAVGKNKTVTPDMLKKGSILIGVGLFVDEEEKLRGDFHKDEIADIVSYYSPTPGGIGPVNVACLMKNLVKASG